MYTVQVADEKELQLIGKYIVGLYRMNYFVVAGYVAANTFESIINIFLESQGKLKFQCETHECLHEKIKSLNISNVNRDFNLEITYGSLITLKDTRNDIVHGFIRDIKSLKIKQIVEFIWNVVSIEIDEAEMDIDLINLKTAQYWVRDFEVITDSESPKINNNNKIQVKDFLDLYKMRHRFLELEHFLDGNKRLGKLKKYSIDSVSAVNPTSAYVWLAIVDDHKRSRKKIFGPSVSILATPLDIRIYLDFGGFAFDYRKKYFEFLRTYDFGSLDIDKKELYIFDIDWYSFLIEKQSFNTYIQNPMFNQKIKDASELLDREDQSVPLSWNKLLIGYIINRQSIQDNGLEYNEMWEKIKYITYLYDEFMRAIGEESTIKIVAKVSDDKLNDLKNKFSM